MYAQPIDSRGIARSFVLPEPRAAKRSASKLGLLGRLAQAARVKRAERRSVKALASLDDNRLKDIGVKRAEIRERARKAAEARRAS